MQTTAFPSVTDLDRLPVEAFVSEMAPLVEGAPAFLEVLAGSRPLETDERLMTGAFDLRTPCPRRLRCS